MKHFQARTEDKLRRLSNLTDFAIHKTSSLFKKEPSLKNVQNILLIELKRIGDIIVSTPTIRTLKQNFPNAKLDVIVPPKMEDILYKNPHIHKILTWDRAKLKENYGDYLLDLKKNKYDLAVILHNGTFLVSKLLKEARIPYRIGCTRVGLREPKGYFLTKQLLPDKKLKHKIEDNLDVLKLINIYPLNSKHPEIYVDKKAEFSLKRLINLRSNDLIIVISPVSYTHPTWFKERFADLADKLYKKYKARIIFVGTKKEKKFISEIQKLMKEKALNLSGKTSLQELFALIKRANLIVGIDSASTNIASALKTPVVALFGAGDSIIWKPINKTSISIQRKHEVCTACMKSRCKYQDHRHLECMKAISVEDVLRAIERLGF